MSLEEEREKKLMASLIIDFRKKGQKTKQNGSFCFI